MQTIDVPLNKLFIDHDFNHRGRVIPMDVIDLARQIERDGLQTPINVQPYNKDGYEYRVVAGHRRATAFKVLKRETIPAFVNVYPNEMEAKKASLIENLHRVDLNILQQAKALKPFVERGMIDEDIALYLSVSRAWVAVRLKLLDLDPRVQEYAAAGLLTQDDIKKLHGKSPTQQLEYVKEIKHNKERRDKIEPEPKKQANPNVASPKTRSEMFEMITIVYPVMGMGFWSRCLSWAAGSISTNELLRDLEEWAMEHGKEYTAPK